MKRLEDVLSEMDLQVGFAVGDFVYLKTNPDQYKRIVLGFCIRDNSITYQLGKGGSDSWHYGIEISLDKDLVTQLNG